MISGKNRRNPRRKIGGDIWNNRIDMIRRSTKTASDAIRQINKILTELHRLFEERKNLPFVAVWVFHIGNISTRLTTVQNELTVILQAIDEIEEITLAVAKEQQQLTIVKPERKIG